MGEGMVQKGEELSRETVREGDLAKQVEELKRQVENMKAGSRR